MEQVVRRKEFNFLWESKVPFKAVVAARGSGKTVAAIQYILESLLTGKPNDKAIFFGSTLGQVTGTVEPYIRELTSNFPKNFCKYNSSKHRYSFFVSDTDIRELRLASYEIQEHARGFHPKLIVLDECAEMPDGMWGNVILPMLHDMSGSLIAIGTPRGHDKFYELFCNGLSPEHPEWESYAIRASEHPNLFDPKMLAIRRNNQTKAEYAQEYECNFEANVLVGAVYMEYIREFTEKRIDDTYAWNPELPVYTAWDIGFSDYTAIWFFQKKNDVVNFIDYLEADGQLIPYYANELMRKPYTIHTCFLPQDGKAGNIRGAPVIDQLSQFGFKCEIARWMREQDGVNQARTLLQTCCFNKSNCALGLERLKHFKYRLDKRTSEKIGFQHDENSHGADAFRYASICIKDLNASSNKTMMRPRINFSAFR